MGQFNERPSQIFVSVIGVIEDLQQFRSGSLELGAIDTLTVGPPDLTLSTDQMHGPLTNQQEPFTQQVSQCAFFEGLNVTGRQDAQAHQVG